ncbi:MAG: hypothetical protein VB081_13060 [Christensenella sp.]|uniref:hypothetical protein n=1 Tax=Christensenella sp. TaxID=1935934 RepID=UPI002B21ED57|nr:hypothetical protein [Christensenella sp.]MEA5004408.1 hypothetical protein [Christensenella sp.]
MLNSSLIAIPYLLFLKLIDGTNLETILPLVIFYTLRMTGVFLLRSIKTGAGSYSALMFSFILGFIGALFGVMGTLYFPLFMVSAIFLGLSTAFVKPIFTTINFHRHDEKKEVGTAEKKKKNLFPLAFVVVFLLALMALPGTIQTFAVMLLYVALFAMALYSTSRDPEYKFRLIHLKDTTVSFKGAAIFIVFFALLAVLRIARRTLDAQQLDAVTFWFSVAFLIAMLVVFLCRKRRKLPLWLNMVSLTNGMCGNFLFIFGSFYIGALYGINAATAYVYIPFVLGMGAAMAFSSKVQQLFKKTSPFVVQMTGVCISLILLMTPLFFPVSIFLVSFFFSGTSSWLDRKYYDTQSIPYDRRLISKFTLQDIGSISYQFIVAVMVLIIFQYYQMPTATFFTLTENVTHSAALVSAMHVAKFWGCLILAVLFGGSLLSFRKSHREKQVDR